MADKYTRAISFNERIYLAAERLKPGFCIQIVFEGERAAGEIVFDQAHLFLDRLRLAVVQVAASNPGCRLVARGFGVKARWADEGPLPQVRRAGAWSDDGLPPQDLDRPLDPQSGPTCEIVVSFEPLPRLVFRCFHGVMDAGGLLHFAEEVFRALRGETLKGTNSVLNDTQFVKSKVGSVRRAALDDACAPMGHADLSRAKTVSWHRFHVTGGGFGVVAKIAAHVGQHAPRLPNSVTRIMVPVDVRNYDRAMLTTANMSYPLFLNLAEGEQWQAVHKRILKGLMSKEMMRLDPMEDLGPYLPLGLLRFIYGAWTRGHRRKMRFPFTALVTHVSITKPELFSYEGLQFNAAFILPPQSEFIPLCVSVVTMADRIDVVVSGPNDLIEPDELASLGQSIKSCLEPIHSAN